MSDADNRLNSKYVNPTGDGYLGTYRVGVGHASITQGALTDVDWTADHDVHAIRENGHVAVVADPNAFDPDRHLGQRRLGQQYRELSFKLGQPELDVLGVTEGDQVRVYDRDGDGIRVVNAAADPFVDNRGDCP